MLRAVEERDAAARGPAEEAQEQLGHGSLIGTGPPRLNLDRVVLPARTAIDSREMDISERAKAFHEHDGDWPSLLHQDIEVRLLITFEQPVTGKDNVVKALTEGRAANLYTGSVSSVELLDDSTVLASGSARYALHGGGFAHGAAFWLDEFEDGLLRRSRVFRSREDALSARH